MDKYNKLKKYISSLERVAVAFSGGIDSAFLLKAAVDALGSNVMAITANPHSFPQRELEQTKVFCAELGVKHIIFDVDELSIEGFAQNTADRCYICKKHIFSKMIQLAGNHNIQNLAEGSNVDDIGDYRPGLKAIEELKILSPLKIVGYTKAEIRECAKALGIEFWNKQSSACLASRFAYNEVITQQKLEMVENAEQALFELGFTQFRVRIHNRLARIEVLPQEIELVIKNRTYIYSKFKEIGFLYITLDLLGYRTGSMNEALNLKKE